MPEMTVFLWDKKTPINGVAPERLTEKFTKENGNTDRVLIAYDGVISRIQRVDTSMFNDEEKQHVLDLVNLDIPND